jgi:hypothetical protein
MYQKRLIVEGLTEIKTEHCAFVDILPRWGAAVLRPYMTVPSERAAM